MKDLILITGASTGIGREMAKLLAAQKYDLIIVARNVDKLHLLKVELETQFGITVHVMAKDLSEAGQAQQLYADIKQKGLTVTMLVNNAGVGMYGDFIKIDLEQQLKMIELNISAVVALTRLFGADMAARGSGKIMNVASLLSFLPFPYYSVYSATKAFVLAFSETISAELEGTGVIITTLCPGPTDTPFNTDAMWQTNAYKTNKPISPAIVAADGVKLLLHGKGKKIVGFNNWFISNLPRITPDSIMMKIKKNLASRSV